MKFILFSLSLLLSVAYAQERIDGDFAFDSDPAKKYSLYIPSGYEAGSAHKTMLALHPFNPDRWDAISWCDTLTDFAEANSLILICPDGGTDGRIDDPIDTAFTSALIDSVAQWYSVDFGKFYGMGFSWGARGLYTYGLSHVPLIKGYIPIGAAITGTTEVTEDLQINATGFPFYIVHGSLDAPASRFFPIRDSLISKGAKVETNLLSGVGHTIDFPDRNDILTVAYEWIDSVNCSTLGIESYNLETGSLNFYPNPLKRGSELTIENDSDIADTYFVEIRTLDGKLISANSFVINPGKMTFDPGLNAGTFLISVSNQEAVQSFRLLVQN